MADSPASSLSTLSSDDFVEEVPHTDRSSRPSIDMHTSHDIDTLMPPSKRRRTGPSSLWHERATSSQPPSHASEAPSDVSSDTSGSAPGSPTHDEYAVVAEQLTTCQWLDCAAGDLGNIDNLVQHVHADHIGAKRARYQCDWGECAKKGTNHPSGYALKAHMRSHTKEKPFYCALPECDRSFTRSDALAKHMRTVHETTPLHLPNNGTSAPLPQSAKKGAKLRTQTASTHPDGGRAAPLPQTQIQQLLVLPSNEDIHDPSSQKDNIMYIPAHHPLTGQPGFMIHYPPDIQMSPFESSIPADQLMRLFRRQLRWATEDSEALERECERLEGVKRTEWRKKEAVLGAVMEAEAAWGQNDAEFEEMRKDVGDMKTKWKGERPWWQTDKLIDHNNERNREDGTDAIEASGSESGSDSEEDGVYAAERGKGTVQEREDDMMAVGALLGLSGGNADAA
ncbi:hypothetical protein LTR66_007851 [Elasticomyces elasticus]|nr:hypothetical protein LTR50_006689 [Elasticomyces elasticus]KAK4986527.1 hypothetical protein LTR66_007851 [Elasticomyces elasticus]